MSSPVSPLALNPAVGDGVTLLTCEQNLLTLLLRSHLTHGAGLPVLHRLGVKLGHLYFQLNQFVLISTLLLDLVICSDSNGK